MTNDERADFQQQQDEELRRLQEENVLHPCPRHPEREQLDPGVSEKQCCAECYQAKRDAYADAMIYSYRERIHGNPDYLPEKRNDGHQYIGQDPFLVNRGDR